MVDVGWTVHVGWVIPILLAGVIIGCLILGFFAGAKEPKCDRCILALKDRCEKQKPSKLWLEPPPKHNWELTHIDKPTRSPYRRNERRSKV